MIKKIIYIHETFYRKHRDMGIDIFRKKGYEVELWSTLKIKYKNTLEVPKDNTDEFVLYFNNHIHLIKEILKQDWKHTMCFFTTTAHRGGIEDFIRIIIGIAGGRYCNFIYEILPIGKISENLKKNFQEKLQSAYSKYKYKFYQFLVSKYFKPTFCFVPTYYSTKKLLTVQEKKVFIEVHNKDYDEYLLNKPEDSKERYILFLDDDITNAEDLRKNNTYSIYPQASIYYDNINKAFKQLEKFYGIPVYIAAHPKNELMGDEFEGRKIFYYQTSRLVQNAELILTHASAAVNYIILYKKPYIFFVDKYIRKHMIWKYLFLPQIRELKAIQYDFGQGNEPWKYINQPNKNYDLYRERYIKNANFNKKLFYEIVEKTIRKA
ncbi:hypothetical protein AALB47_02300 [Lachnospiraceae bacterium 54-11]